VNAEKTKFRRRLMLAKPALNEVAEATYHIGRRGMSDNAVAVKTYLQVSRNQHATRRAAGWLHGSRVPTGLLPAGESGCAVDLLGRT
jgi:hypothetical protein